MRIQFASIFISDDQQAIDFYTHKLGFKLLVNRPTPVGVNFLMFGSPDGGADLVASRLLPNVPEAKIGGFSNIAFEAEDIQATYEELSARGVQFPQPPTKQPWGGVQARFADPDGNVFQLNQV